MKKLYGNIGKKLKTIAVVATVILSVACVICAIVLLANSDGYYWFYAVPMIFVGPIIIWLSSLVLYAFGEIVDKLVQIEENTRRNGNQLGVILLQSGNSVIIKEVNPGSIAEKSGLCENDKLLEINGTEITNIDIARYTVIHRTKPGQTVPFVIERDGVKMTLNVTF